ncbi:MAG: GspMb/PilO family protein [Blastocatellia bacterium]
MSSQVRERAPHVEVRSTARSARPFGLSPKEIVAAALALLFFVVVIVYYFTSLRPEQARLRQLEQRLREQDALVNDTPAAGETAAPVNTGKEALSSLETFIAGRLRPLSPGRIALQNELNALIKKNGLQLTSSIETHVDTMKGQGDQAGGRRMKLEDMFNVFPRQSIHFVVFGQYPNLRAFLSDLEHNKQFLVIKSVNFTTQEDTGEGGRRQRAAASGIMLSVDLTAYFQP